MRRATNFILIVFLVGIGAGFGQVEKPSDLKFPPLKFEPPDPRAFRMQLANGLRAYIQEDKSLPLVTISALVNFGNLYVLKDKAGLGSLMSETLIKGGTRTRGGGVIEERGGFSGGAPSFFVGGGS